MEVGVEGMRNPAPPREIPYQDSLSRKWRDMASPCLGAGGRRTQMHTHIHTCIHTHVPCVGLAPRTLQIDLAVLTFYGTHSGKSTQSNKKIIRTHLNMVFRVKWQFKVNNTKSNTKALRGILKQLHLVQLHQNSFTHVSVLPVLLGS